MTTIVSEPNSQPKPSRKRVEKRTPGGMEGKVWMAPDFDEPDEELMDLVENSTLFPDDSEASKQ